MRRLSMKRNPSAPIMPRRRRAQNGAEGACDGTRYDTSILSDEFMAYFGAMVGVVAAAVALGAGCG